MYNEKAIKRYEEGRILHQNGKLSAAERAYKKAIQVNADFAEAHNNLGNVLLDRGRFKEAVAAYRKALKLMANHPMLLNNIGNALQLQGDNETALNWLDKAIGQDPNYADAYNNSGNALRLLGKSDTAVVAYQRAIELDPDMVNAHHNLGGILIELERLDEAIECFNKALGINPEDSLAYQGLARARNQQGDFDQTVCAYQQAIKINPGNAEYYQELGKTFSDYGEIEKSNNAYRIAIELDPERAHIYRSISKNRKFHEYDEDIRKMESLYARKGISDEQSMHLAFALGKAYEDLGEFEKAMTFVIEAARLQRNLIDYSVPRSQKLFRQVREVFTPGFFASHIDSGDPDPTPIFILGMPRSGTSLVEQILSSHPDVFGGGELNNLANIVDTTLSSDDPESPSTYPQGLIDLDTCAFADIGKAYIASLRRNSTGTRFITDKMPHNFLRIGLIRAVLPNARIIHCTRDPMDNCLSLFKTYFPRGHQYSYDLVELGQYYKSYLELMDYWRETLPDIFYDQSYENLVMQPKDQVSELLEYCNLPWDETCLDFHKSRRKVKTASSAQVRRPIYQHSVQLWKRYEQQLEPLKISLCR